MKKYKKLTAKLIQSIESNVKLMLAAHRDCLWNRHTSPVMDPIDRPTRPDPLKVSYDCWDGYYGEAFGIMRGLEVLGFGFLGCDNLNAVQLNKSDEPRHNLKWWFARLKNEILEEEGFRDGTATKEKAYAMLEKYQKLGECQ